MASKKAEDREPLPGAVKKRGEAKEAGGGNLHRGRGATAWGREDKRRRDRGRRGQPPQGTGSHCLGPRRQERSRQRPLFGAEDVESRLAGATSQEAESNLRTGSHCLGLKMWNQDWPGQPPKRPRPKAEDGASCLGPKMRNQDHEAVKKGATKADGANSLFSVGRVHFV